MIRIVKLDKKDNYLIDSSTNSLLERYDPENPNLKLVIKLEDSVLAVDADKIKMEYGNQLVVDYNDEKFIIDDGYQNILIKAGYVVYKDYDKDNIFDKEEGTETRNKVLNYIRKSINNVLSINDSYHDNNSEFIVTYNSDNYQYTIVLETVNSIVSKNQIRKDNSLPFYPFLKQMDKYGTVYISIFAQKLERVNNEVYNIKFKHADNFIKQLMIEAGSDYHFANQLIKRRLIYAKGI